MSHRNTVHLISSVHSETFTLKSAAAVLPYIYILYSQLVARPFWTFSFNDAVSARFVLVIVAENAFSLDVVCDLQGCSWCDSNLEAAGGGAEDQPDLDLSDAETGERRDREETLLSSPAAILL